MESLLLILDFFGGLILIFTISWLMGKLFKLDKYNEEFQVSKAKSKSKNKFSNQ